MDEEVLCHFVLNELQKKLVTDPAMSKKFAELSQMFDDK
jgi:hypothetical protein